MLPAAGSKAQCTLFNLAWRVTAVQYWPCTARQCVQLLQYVTVEELSLLSCEASHHFEIRPPWQQCVAPVGACCTYLRVVNCLQCPRSSSSSNSSSSKVARSQSQRGSAANSSATCASSTYRGIVAQQSHC